MKFEANYGIRAALLTSALIANASSANAEYDLNLTHIEREKMESLRLNPQEFAFLKEYTNLVQKFPELKGTFGLARLHQHFEVGSHETLHETSDPTTRISKTVVLPIDELPSTALPAILDDGGGLIMDVKVKGWCCD